jgi:hypothetical protein
MRTTRYHLINYDETEDSIIFLSLSYYHTSYHIILVLYNTMFVCLQKRRGLKFICNGITMGMGIAATNGPPHPCPPCVLATVDIVLRFFELQPPALELHHKTPSPLAPAERAESRSQVFGREDFRSEARRIQALSTGTK